MKQRPFLPPLLGTRPVALVLLIALGLWWTSSGRPVTQAAGILVPTPPLQLSLMHQDALPYEASWHANGFEVVPLAQYHLRARVLSSKRYYYGATAKLSPLDIVFGWGPMSDTTLLDTIGIWQSNRWYYWFTRQAPVPLRDIEVNSANTHLIPASAGIARVLKRLRVGEVVELTGYLVEATGKDGSIWRSSLTREDTGAGACELFWVESVWVLGAADLLR